LHRGSGDFTGLGIHGHGGKGGTPQAIPAGSAAEYNNQVTQLGLTRVCIPGRNSQAAAKHQRVGGISRVKPDRPRNCWQANLIAVILDACHHAGKNPAGVQHTRRKRLDGAILWSKAQDIGGSHRFGGHSQDVPDHSACTRVGSAKWLNRGRMVMGFHLEGNCIDAIVFHQSGVIHKSGNHPGRPDGFGGSPDGLAEQVGDDFRLRVVCPFHLDAGIECFMLAMLAPCLGDHFKFHIGQVTIFSPAVRLDGLHFHQVQGGAPLAGKCQQAVIVQAADGNVFHRVVGAGWCGKGWFNFPQRMMLNDRVGKQSLRQEAAFQGCQLRALQFKPQAGGGSQHAGDAQHVGGADNLLCHRVRDARAEGNFNNENSV